MLALSCIACLGLWSTLINRNREKRQLLKPRLPPPANSAANGQREEAEQRQHTCGETAEPRVDPETSKQRVVKCPDFGSEHYARDWHRDSHEHRDDHQNFDAGHRAAETKIGRAHV